ncbi:mtss-1 [Pristionchus pacificus]|uniref:Mtss-1 n=1 Tax=Pristionchus pacificus TaxID=54126 RepID=A0A2A6BAD1_PRIPA|nr:mtss-1 [Pristionchus pacificus]|eukprot:PDM62826.1 mtss-1 [Pristionchus pacificus]
MLRMLRSAVAVSSRIATGVRAMSTSAVSKSDAKPSKADMNEVFKDNAAPRRRNAYSVNRVELIGGVSDEPRKLVAKNGKDYVILNVITNNTTKLPGGEVVETADRHSVTVFGKAADFVERNVTKGTRVVVHGRLHQSGGKLKEDGTYSQRQTNIHAEMVTPLARSTN